ncbi:MAG: GTP cyclohydrolase II [Actinobacteria bacterium]|nr:GTP cyclohydrolase II [Actinomycetota bacterium]
MVSANNNSGIGNEIKFFYSIEETTEDIKNGNIAIIVDDRSSDNEGVLFQAAEKVDVGSMNFFMNHGKSLVYLPALQKRLKELEIPVFERKTNEQAKKCDDEFHETAAGPLPAMSIDYVQRRGSGASAADRALTVKEFINKKSKPSHFIMPGHIFPLSYHEGGVLARAGHTEAAVDLAKIAGLYPAGIISEIIKEDGEVAKLTDLIEISKKYGLKIITIEELIRYRKRKEKLIERVSEINLPTKWGSFRTVTYRSTINPETHIAFVKGDVANKSNVPVRVHSQCLTGDTFGSQRCDCGEQLDAAFKYINKTGYGVLLYMAQEGRGIGLCNKMKAYELQDRGLDTVEANLELGFEADMRDYGIGAQILADLGLSTIQLMTNNPRKIVGLKGYGISITKIIPIIITPNKNNLRYLSTKKSKLNHMLD